MATTLQDILEKADAVAPKACHRLGSIQNPIALPVNFIVNMYRLAARLLSIGLSLGTSGNIGVRLPGRSLPDQLETRAVYGILKANLSPGDWFYFAAEPNILGYWNGERTSKGYDRKSRRHIYFQGRGVRFNSDLEA
jgi:hypothetical protein